MRFTATTTRADVIREKIAIRESMLTYARQHDRKRIGEHEAALVQLRAWLKSS